MNSKPRRLMHRAMPLILGGSLVKQIVIALVLGILLALGWFRTGYYEPAAEGVRAQLSPWAFWVAFLCRP